MVLTLRQVREGPDLRSYEAAIKGGVEDGPSLLVRTQFTCSSFASQVSNEVGWRVAHHSWWGL